MRAFVLTLVIGVMSLGGLALTASPGDAQEFPSNADTVAVRWHGGYGNRGWRGGSHYYTPYYGYNSYYTPYYGGYGGYGNYYSPGYGNYYSPGYGNYYSPGYSGYYSPGYNYYGSGYRSYYGPGVSFRFGW